MSMVGKGGYRLRRNGDAAAECFAAAAEVPASIQRSLAANGYAGGGDE